MTIETENPPFELPIYRVHRKGSRNVVVPALFVFTSALVAANYYIHRRFGLPQLDILTVTLGFLEASSVALMLLSPFYSASLTIDRSGIESEKWGVRRSWPWKDVSDVRVIIFSSGKGPASALLHILPRGQDQNWVRIWSGGLNPWRLAATIRKGMQIWGKVQSPDGASPTNI